MGTLRCQYLDSTRDNVHHGKLACCVRTFRARVVFALPGGKLIKCFDEEVEGDSANKLLVLIRQSVLKLLALIRKNNIDLVTAINDTHQGYLGKYSPCNSNDA